MTTILHRLFPL